MDPITITIATGVVPYVPMKEMNMIVKQATKAAQQEFSKQESKKSLAEEAYLLENDLQWGC